MKTYEVTMRDLSKILIEADSYATERRLLTLYKDEVAVASFAYRYWMKIEEVEVDV